MNTKLKITSILMILLLSCNIDAQTKHQLPKLNYDYNELEPFIDAQTMEIHYSKHHQGYVNKLNKAILDTDAENMPLEKVLKNVSQYSTAIRNNAGGHYNHTLFWSILTPRKGTAPSNRLLEAINSQFGSLDSLKSDLNQAASSRFGSGWAWLSVNNNKKLMISSTPNQDNPLMDDAEKKGTPILGIDVWEHAYYLKYQNKRGDYLSAIWNIINWDEVSKRYEALIPKGKFDDWPELKSFHKVMAQTFHPSEEGNLAPIKSRNAEMVKNAEILSQSKIPAEYDTKGMKNELNKLVKATKKLEKQIQAKASDEKITKSLTEVHDVFHQIIGLCSNEEHH